MNPTSMWLYTHPQWWSPFQCSISYNNGDYYFHVVWYIPHNGGHHYDMVCKYSKMMDTTLMSYRICRVFLYTITYVMVDTIDVVGYIHYNGGHHFNAV
ncbi:hypothetical protein CEXT_633601 [Caerostris extrusa]|uniref:Uncharacterized protein n=1 Tax=Caerostris extrusa TaxID=172846 RepID=A0AAV4RI00_CAEEX|nr:hypothetical protein CEXT_633601 [Caerostris extrusa]